MLGRNYMYQYIGIISLGYKKVEGLEFRVEGGKGR